MTGPGYARAIKYKVSPPWWVGTDVALMNAKVFDSLSPELQKLLADTMIEIEKEVPDYFLAKEKEEDDAMAKMGIQNIPTSEADLQRIRKLHWEGGTEAFLLKPSPKYGPGLMKLVEGFVTK